jgi:hypothetical protein
VTVGITVSGSDATRADGSPDPRSFRALLFDHPTFAEAAYEALRRSRYEPGRVNGEPVPMLVSQRVTFQARSMES